LCRRFLGYACPLFSPATAVRPCSPQLFLVPAGFFFFFFFSVFSWILPLSGRGPSRACAIPCLGVRAFTQMRIVCPSPLILSSSQGAFSFLREGADANFGFGSFPNVFAPELRRPLPSSSFFWPFRFFFYLFPRFPSTLPSPPHRIFSLQRIKASDRCVSLLISRSFFPIFFPQVAFRLDSPLSLSSLFFLFLHHHRAIFSDADSFASFFFWRPSLTPFLFFFPQIC